MKTLRGNEPNLFDRHGGGRKGVDLPTADVPRSRNVPHHLVRTMQPEIPQLSEVEVVRHYTRLSKLNYGVDDGFYPLGSCTMKHNPKVNELIAGMDGFKWSHPMLPYDMVQGSLAAMKWLMDLLSEITGMDDTSLQPAAGAHGELTGMLMIRAYHEQNGNPRKVVLIPDSAHGTNPATCTFAGYQVQEVRSDETGCVDLDHLAEVLNEDVAAMMLTNPNTLGVFERNITRIADMLHEKGAQLYMDGANMNAMMGKTRPGELGADVLHLNLHKTFSTPHGGGGPGAGPVCFKSHLAPFQPTPVVREADGSFTLDWTGTDSLGKVHGFYGNFLVTLKALAYVLSLGGAGLERATEDAVLGANYIRAALADSYHLSYETPTLHEVVFSDKFLEEYGVKTLDVAKRLIDYGIHPPTVYFPLIVHGAIMIEPTETESREEIDYFIGVMEKIVAEARTNPELLHDAPHDTPVRRLDETAAARNPVLRWKPEEA